MRTVIEFNKHLKIGNTNVEYEKIYNCRAIEPTYEKGKGLFNSEFFLDKRLGMEEFVSGEYHYTDDIELYGYKYYLYHNDTNMYVGVESGGGLTEIASFDYSSNNPLLFTIGRGANGELKESNLTINNGATYDNPTNNTIINEEGVYEDGYVVLDVGAGLDITVGDYVLFKNNVFAGATVRVDLYQGGLIYILGINRNGSIPLVGDTIDIYSDTGKIPLVGTSDGVYTIHINGDNVCGTTNILGGNIDDLTSFNEEVFALKDNVIYWSQRTFDDNTQFYSATDRRRIRGAYKLISKGKFLIVLGDDNRLVTPAVEIQNITGDYSFYPLNYNGDLYSKYSYLFTDTALYLCQSDKKLVKVEVSSLNATAFNLDTESITKTVRGLFSEIDDYNSISKGDIFMNDNKIDGKIHMFYQKIDGTTIEYEYDKDYKHWLLHTYNNRVYKKSDRWLMYLHLSNINGYTDLGEEYEQSINFTIQIPNLITNVGLIRMIMGISNDRPLLYNLDIDVESSHSITNKHIEVKDLTFDTMPIDHSLDILNILNNGRDNKHDGSIASIQRTIMMSGRIHRYNINGYKRFIYGYSYLLGEPSNIFVNERNFSK